MRNRNILIMAGGTGGHIYPALVVADQLEKKGFNLFWLGTNKGMESELIPEYGYPLLTINIAGIRSKGLLHLLLTALMSFFALLQSILIMIKIKPVLVLGMGGFVSGPGGIAAWLMRVPLLIHEQNAVIGLSNRLLAPFSASLMSAFPNVFKPSEKLTVTGNPVRKVIIDIPDPEKRFIERDKDMFRILIVGGSLGALRLNQVLPEVFSALTNCRFKIKHQCGKKHLEFTKKLYTDLDVKAEVLPFIEDMASAYAWADIVICRAGALTIAELAACGVGSVLIPYPYAVDDHQTANAQYLSRNGAAILLQEKQLSVEEMKNILLTLYHSSDRCLEMALKARSLAQPRATDIVVELCMDITDA